MANRNFPSQRLYSMHAMQVQIDASFTVLATNADGISGLKAPGVQNIFMHTSTTPSASNPNPAAGNIIVRLQDNYQRLIAVEAMLQSANSGSDVKIDNSAMTAGAVYVITTLGNATAAKWHTIGVPAGVTPAVGVSFVAASNGGAGNTLTSRVQTQATMTTMNIAVVGNPDTTVAPNPTANQGYGASLILQSFDAAGALIAIPDGAKVFLKLIMSNSTVITGSNSTT